MRIVRLYNRRKSSIFADKMNIRIISPASAIDPQVMERGIQTLQAFGHEVSVGAHARGNIGMFSGTPEERLEDINTAFADPTIDAILCARGGYGLAQILDKIVMPDSFDKLVIGFSDITAFHQLMGVHGIPSLHGNMCRDFNERDQQFLEERQLHYDVPAHPLNRLGTAQGILHGGNMAVMMGLSGTPFAIERLVEREPTILFIEEVNENHHAIDRMMQQLRLSGVLEKIQGLIVGEFADCNDDPRFHCTIHESIAQAVAEYDYPVLFGFPAGHGEVNVPLLLNAPCTIQVKVGENAVCKQ